MASSVNGIANARNGVRVSRPGDKKRKKRRNARTGTVCTEGMKLVVVFVCVALVFFSGIFVGIQFFHSQEDTLTGNSVYPVMVRPPGSPNIRGAGVTLTPAQQQQQRKQDERHLQRQQLAQQQQQEQMQQPPPTPPTPPPRQMQQQQQQQQQRAPPTPPPQQLSAQTPAPVVAVPVPARPMVTDRTVSSVRFSGVESIEVPKQTLDSADGVTVSAWIYLDPNDHTRKMKTVLANRHAGCGTNAARHGYALYVNDWKTENRQLRLMWNDGRDGCKSTVSPNEAIPYGKWTQVGFTIKPSSGRNDYTSSVGLYVNGAIVGQDSTVQRPPQLNTAYPFRIGMHADGEHGFVGNISDVAVLSGHHPEILQQGYFVKADTPGLMAFYRLLDQVTKPKGKGLEQNVCGGGGLN